MIATVAALALAAVLAVAALLKLARPRESAAAMAVYGAATPSLRWLLWGSAVAAELALAVGVGARSATAAYLAAGLMLLFALLMVGAILAGRAGSSCACFGARSRLGWGAVARNLALAAGFVVLPSLPGSELSTEQWLGLGLAVALLGLVGLAVAVLALAREIGMLRLRLGPAADSALEIPEEGPPVGEIVPATVNFPVDQRSSLLLAVFLSEGCHICRTLRPQIETFAADPVLAARILDEIADSDAWHSYAVPGSPYAVACDRDGTALAKGSFNTLAQLESILATAERRRAAWTSTLPGA